KPQSGPASTFSPPTQFCHPAQALGDGVILDLFSRRIVGWSMSERIDRSSPWTHCKWPWRTGGRSAACCTTLIAVVSTPVLITNGCWPTIIQRGLPFGFHLLTIRLSLRSSSSQRREITAFEPGLNTVVVESRLRITSIPLLAATPA